MIRCPTIGGLGADFGYLEDIYREKLLCLAEPQSKERSALGAPVALANP